MTKHSPLMDLQRQAARDLTRALAAPERQRADGYRKVAGSFVSARQHFFTRDGEPDWKGRTHAYRLWVQSVLSMAHVPPDDVAKVGAAIRYHSGNVLRERLDASELEALGLRPLSPRERSVEKRERHTETLAIFGGGGAELTDADTILAAVEMMEAVLARVKVDNGALTAHEKFIVREAAAAVARAAQEIAAPGQEVTK